MSLSDLAERELQSWCTFQGAPRTLDVAEAGDRAVCDLTALDSLGCAFEQLSLQSGRLAGAAIDDIKRISTRLSSKLTYLLEPISPIEVDADRCTVQLRSSPPQKNENKTSYYELVVRRGGEINLCRYAKTPGDVRQVIPACVTREVLLRLTSDFQAAVQ